MDLNHLLHRAQRTKLPISRFQHTALLTGLLVVGLYFAVPTLAGVGRLVGVPILISLLAGLAAVGGLYGLFIVAVGRFRLGVFIALLVLSTTAANLPLTATAGNYPGNLGPQLWLVQVPLVVLVGLYVLESIDTSTRSVSEGFSLTHAEYALGGLVL